jgi:hypothetical protein
MGIHSWSLRGRIGSLPVSGRPRTHRHEQNDASWLAANQIDWWKEDSCNTPGNHSTQPEQIADYAKMRNALNATGASEGAHAGCLRPVVVFR